MDELMQLLLERTEAASARLREAIRIDFHHFVARHVEDRLRARPHFFARTAAGVVSSIRKGVEEEAERVARSMEQQVADLRVYYGASERTEAEEASGLAKTLGEDIAEATRRLLTDWAFPGDDKADRPDVTQIDLDAEYQVAYTPSPAVVWAWRQVRALDEVRNRIADAEKAGRPPEIDFGLRWHLPELVERIEAEKQRN